MSDTDVQPDAATEETTEDRPDAEPDTATEPAEPAEDAETFPRDYVEKLRKESAGYRDKAKVGEARADEFARALFTARVAATGKLADPSDLAFDADHLDDADALNAAIDALAEAKPHLKARRVSGDVGQGQRGDTVEPFSLIDAIKARV